MRNICMKLFEILTSGSGRDAFYLIYNYGGPSCLAGQNHLDNFDTGHYEEQSVKLL